MLDLRVQRFGKTAGPHVKVVVRVTCIWKYLIRNNYSSEYVCIFIDGIDFLFKSKQSIKPTWGLALEFTAGPILQYIFLKYR